MTSTAVVILNYNGEKLLRQFLPSVLQHSGSAEIIVADNKSTDNSLSVLREKFPSVKIIALEDNYGFCGGYNRALRQVKADYYVLLNSDVEVTEGWLEPMISILDLQKDVAAVQPKILSYRDKNKFEYAGAGGGFIDTLGYPFCRGRIFDHVEEDTGQYNDEREVFWATGACFMIRSSVYHHFGGLDEDLFAHMEEIDLCWKIHRTYQKVMYAGKSTVYHLGAGTLGYDNPKKTYLNFRNGLILIFKHLNSTELIIKLPLRMSLDWLAAFVFFLNGKASNGFAVFRAHLHFIKGIQNTLGKRRALRKQYKEYSKRSIHPRPIIFEYYLQNKKIYSDQ